MTRVFIGGSRKVSRLNEEIRRRLDNIIRGGFDVIIGDANGADKAVQSYFAERGYPHVVVFHMAGNCRNNVGHWETRAIPSNGPKSGFEYYATKDREMAKQADYGLMLWDGKSKGTVTNVINLLDADKKVVVYFAPKKQFFTVSNRAHLLELLAACDHSARKKLDHIVGIRAKSDLQQQELSLSDS